MDYETGHDRTDVHRVAAERWLRCSDNWHNRKSPRSRRPSKQQMIFSPLSFFLLAKEELGVRNDKRAFRSHFGTTADVCSALWEMIRFDRRGRH